MVIYSSTSYKSYITRRLKLFNDYKEILRLPFLSNGKYTLYNQMKIRLYNKIKYKKNKFTTEINEETLIHEIKIIYNKRNHDII